MRSSAQWALLLLALSAPTWAMHDDEIDRVPAPQSTQDRCSIALEGSNASASMTSQVYSRGKTRLPFDGNPYLHPMNRLQKEFLESLGASFTRNRVELPRRRELAEAYNAQVQQLIDNGELLEQDALFWGEIYIIDHELKPLGINEEVPAGARLFRPDHEALYYYTSRDPEIRFKIFTKAERDQKIRSGELISEKFEKFNTYLPSHMFDRMMAYGFVTVSDRPNDFIVSYWGQDLDPAMFSSAVLHDLGHLGGMIAEPALMALYRRQAIQNLIGKTVYGFNDLNEALLLLDKEASQKFIGELKQRFSISIDDDPSQVSKELHRFHEQEGGDLFALADYIINAYAEMRYPLGGLARTAEAGLALVNILKIDSKLNRLIYGLKEYSDRQEILEKSKNPGWFKSQFFASRNAENTRRLEFRLGRELEKIRNQMSNFLIEFIHLRRGGNFHEYTIRHYPQLYELIREDYAID